MVEPWSFVMVAAHAESVGAFLKAVGDGPRAFSTLAVWNALAPFVRRDTGEIVCTQRTLAATASVAVGDVSRALARLVDMGALRRDRRGRYRVHPVLMWRGELAKREQAEAAAPRLALVKGS